MTFDGLDQLERASTDKYAWLSAEDFGPDERAADPDLPGFMLIAAARVRTGRG